MAAESLMDAFHETLKDVLFAERQSVKALKKVSKAAQHPELKQALAQHAEESQGQIERLTQVFEIIGKPSRAKTCEAMQGLVSEAEEDLKDFADKPAADEMIIACAQAMEHYKIARYGTLTAWAKKLGHEDAAQLLAETLEEEKRADTLLTEIATKLETV